MSDSEFIIFGLVTAVVVGGVFLMVGLTRRGMAKKVQALAEAAKSLGMTMVAPEPVGGTLEGHFDGVRVTLQVGKARTRRNEGTSYHTTVQAFFDPPLPFELHVGETGPMELFGKKVSSGMLETGDPSFDKELSIHGDLERAGAFLTDERKTALLNYLGTTNSQRTLPSNGGEILDSSRVIFTENRVMAGPAPLKAVIKACVDVVLQLGG